MLVPRAEFLTKDEHKFYTEPLDEEKRKNGKYIDHTIKTLYNAHVNYVTDRVFEVENKLKRNRWDGKIVLDCHHAKYFEKCHTDYKIYSFKDFIRKFRGNLSESESDKVAQVGGRHLSRYNIGSRLSFYKHKYRKYEDKIFAL
jgi:hypothetical protein